MAIFNFGGREIDTTKASSGQLADALTAAGGTVDGSIVAGTVHGVTGGTVTGRVQMGGTTGDKDAR
ncbi:hypothetical protein [Kitasatospora sp. NPDC047058]|uniref:hypothetical protein n=1 Tax=Kitasatospora sp. NPDC047058 TaxID=3155620 RepID=UPI003409295F